MNKRNNFEFDFDFYLNFYPDLKKNKINTKKQALYHYINYGKKSCRLFRRLKYKQQINLSNELKKINNVKF